MRSIGQLLVAAALAWSPFSLAARDVVKETTVYYEVRGATEREIREALNRTRSQFNDEDYDAATEWHVHWTYETRKRKGAYRVESFTTKTGITITLPKWVPPKNPSRPLAEKWESYLEALKRHEQGHKAIALEAAEAIRRRINEIGSRPTRKELAEVVLETASKVLEEFRKKDRRYDWLTDHGADQKASFP